MLRKILEYPDPILREKAEEVEGVNDEIKQLCVDMIETMRKGDGIGLAAPQVGVLKRVIVVECGEKPLALINPKIISKSSEKECDEEGCLSFPDTFYKINRSKKVVVEALNANGKRVEFETSDMLARVLQHEIDHLDGVLIIDRIPFWARIKKIIFK